MAEEVMFLTEKSKFCSIDLDKENVVQEYEFGVGK
jgi:hypothetical protein